VPFRPRRLIASAVIACLWLAAAPTGAQAVTSPKSCGTIEVKGKRYAVRAHVTGCAFARRWSRRYLRRGARPSGWSCQRYSGTSIKFTCRRPGRSYYAVKR
jgi:hypothetical protein